MTFQRVIVLDPGKTTGVVDWDNSASSGLTVDAYELNFEGVCRFLINAVVNSPDTIIVCESFIIGPQTAKNTQAPWSLEVIGVARMVSMLYLGRDIKLQQPAAAKRFSSDQRLKKMKMWTPGKGHANDASRHLLLFLATHGLLPQEVLHELAEMA